MADSVKYNVVLCSEIL